MNFKQLYIQILGCFSFSLLFSLTACGPDTEPDGGNGKGGSGGQEAIVPPMPAQNGSGETNGYYLVWEDTFDGEELDEAFWNIETVKNPANNEIQYYRRNNVSMVLDSVTGRHCLCLTARKEEFGNKPSTSGRVNTKGKVAYKHGKVEALIKLPKTYKGLWPAFWMMGNDYQSVGWPRCGEIDILEMGNSGGFQTKDKSERYLNGACHWGYYKDGAYPNYGKSSVYQYSVQDGEFHLFTLIWDEKEIKTYIDLDKNPNVAPYFTIGIEVPADGPHDLGTCWDTGCYFHKEFFVIFNLAVGGHFPGITDINRITAFNAENNYQAEMLVDYVRIYQK